MQKTITFLLVFLIYTFYLHAQKQPAYSITHFTNDNGLPQSSIKSAELDKNGFLWIATEGGLVRFDGQQFKQYDREHYPVLASNRIIRITLARDSMICLMDEYNHAYTFDRHYQLKRITDKEYKKRINPPGLLFFRIRENHIMFLRASDEYIFWDKVVHDIDPDLKGGKGHLDGKLYYWSTHGGINSVDSHGNISSVKLKGALTSLPPALPKTQHRFIEQGKRVYILLDSEIYQVKTTGENELTCTPALTVNNIRRIEIFRDYPELNLKIVGSLTDGLYLFKKKDFQVAVNNTGYQNFYAQAIFQDSGVITYNGIIFPSSSYFNPLLPNADAYRSLLQDSRKHYWINTDQGLEHYISELDTALQVIRKIPIDREGIGCFVETPDGRLWVSSFFGNRIGMLKDNSIKWLNIPLFQKSVLTFIAENNDIFWIGGYNTLLRLNVKTREQVHFKALESYIIERLYLDRQKVMWIGTTGNGFFALKNGKIHSLPLDKNGYLKTTHTFLEDKSGFMWMSTNNGLFRCKKNDLLDYMDGKIDHVYYQYFSKESGFNTNEFNGNCNPSAVTFKDGKFSLPSMDGLVQFYPDSIKQDALAYQIFIDRLFVDGKEHHLDGPLTLEPSFKHLDIELSAPFYGHPDNQVLEYNLLGFDNKWYPVRSDNIVTLNTLTYGDYRLQIRKKGGSGTGNNKAVTTSLSFSVKPFFYQTRLFKLGLLVIVFLGGWLFVKARYAYLTMKNKKLEEEINARTISLRNANRLKEKILLMVGHDLQSPLHFLSYLSQLNYDTLAEKQHSKASEISLEIKNTSRKISSFVEEFNLWARVQDESFNPRSSWFLLRPLLEELVFFFKELMELKGNTMHLNVHDSFEIKASRPLLKSILRNILDNANKNTRNGTITISWIIDEDGKGTITIVDTGSGMGADELEKIESLISATRESISVEPDGSLGYQFIADFASRINAKLAIQSREGEGTAVYITGLEVKTSKIVEPVNAQQPQRH